MTPGDARGDYSSIRLSHADSFLFEQRAAEALDCCDLAIYAVIAVVIILECGLFGLI